MNYTKIDLNNWSRAELFNMYIENMRIVMSLTVETDVTQLIRFTKKNSLKFYPCMVWIVSKIVNCHDEFKYGWDSSGNLIRWNCVFPSYVNFSKEDESFTKLVTPFSEDIFSFYSDVINDREKYRKVRGIAKNQPPNFFDVSCLPWVHYSHFDLHVFDEGKYLAPVITWGQFKPDGDRVTLPLTMNIHHAVADGFHLSRFFCEVQTLINSLK